MALVTMVVPWAIATAPGASADSPSSTPRAGASGVVRTFFALIARDAGSRATRSVNVPPTSTPTRRVTGGTLLPLRPLRDGEDHVPGGHLERPHRPVLPALELHDDRPHADVLARLVELDPRPGHEEVGRLDVGPGQGDPGGLGIGGAGPVDGVDEGDEPGD